MSSKARIVTAISCAVPPSVASRGVNIPQELVTEDFLSLYDSQTLFYDAVRVGRRIRLFCPSLGQFAQFIRQAEFRVGTRRVRPRITKRRARYTEIDLPAGSTDDMSIRCEGWTWEGNPSQQETALFEGTNATVLFNKDNDLQWITDQLYFHKRNHGLNAAVIVDNGSETYSIEALLDAVAHLDLAAVRLLSIPVRWGPLGPPAYRNRSLFFQSAALNLVRLRFLRHARAVLVCDIDEVVLPRKDGLSVFDVAANRWHGWVPFKGTCLYPRPDKDGLPRHADHTLQNRIPERPTRKYCVAMNRPVGRFGWKVHRPDTWRFDKYMDRTFFWLGHCQGIKSGWKDGAVPSSAGLVESVEASKAFRETWPELGAEGGSA